MNVGDSMTKVENALKLNNQKSCLNPIRYTDRECEQCSLYDQCVYEKKGKYGRK
jgi:hypothetical protein